MEIINFKLVSLLFVLIEISQTRLSCKNENGDLVDWYIAIKPPHLNSFSYFTSQHEFKKWQLSSYNLTDDRNLVALTIKQAYKSKCDESFHVFYNDQDPSYTYNENKAHAKGVLNFNQREGFWLIHSVPKFPFINTYGYGYSQLKFGQSFICVSIKFENLESIVDQLLMMETNVYDSFVPNNFSSSQNLKDKIHSLINNRIKYDKDSNIINFQTIQNFNLIHFGKGKLFNKDLYADLMALNLKGSMMVETWIRRNKIVSSCSSLFKVYNVEDINIDGETYHTTQDHCKWAVSISSANPFVCIGDINRMYSQFKRGGGSLCIRNKSAWNLFNNLVKDIEPCPKNEIFDFLSKMMNLK